MLLILRLYLIVNLVVYWGYTVGFFVMPARLAEMLDITLRSNTGVADFRAMYGGLCLAAGLVFLLGLLKQGWRAPALLLAAAGAGGLFIGRAWTLVADGPATMWIYFNMAQEVGAVVIGIWLLRRQDIAPAPQ